MKIKGGVVLLIAAILSSCVHPDISRRLDAAESVLEERPDSALAIIRSIDTLSLHARAVRARYSLLHAMALDKNYIDDGRFASRVADAVTWFSLHGQKRKRMLAQYYYGDQLLDGGRNEEAAVQLMRAEQDAVAQSDWLYAGMSARGLYYVFVKSYNIPESIGSIERAMNYFHHAGKGGHEDHARILMANACYNQHELKKADSLFNVALGKASLEKDTLRWYIALTGSANTLLAESPPRVDSAIARLKRAESLGRPLDARSHAAYALAEALRGNQRQSAGHLRSAYEIARSPAEGMNVLYRDYQIRLEQGDFIGAFPLLKEINTYTDSVTNIALQSSVTRAQNLFLMSQNQRMTEQRKYLQIILTILGLLLASFLFIFYLVNKQRREKEQNLQLQLDRYLMACEELKYANIASLDPISEAYYKSSRARREQDLLSAYRSVIEQFRNDTSYRSRLFAAIDRTNDHVITKLKDQVPSIHDNQLALFAYLVYGFSYTTISLILHETSKQYLYNRRHDLISLINKNNPPDKALFLKYLRNRPTRKPVAPEIS